VLSQEHDPKSKEEIISINKNSARGDHTNYWVLYNPSTSGSSGSSYQTSNNRPRIDFRGTDHCTWENKCGLCMGDCDYDWQCEEGMICRERDEYESFDECSGGGSDSSRKFHSCACKRLQSGYHLVNSFIPLFHYRI